MYKIINFPTLSSTNQYLKENYKKYDEFVVVTTDNQTNGKGRMDRVWNSSKDDLIFSILLKPKFDSSKIPLISLIMGASLCNVINKYQNCSIKWPNDIIINDKKIAGILVEAISSYEIGRTIPDASILRDLSDALEVSADWLTGRTQIENESFVNSILHDIVLIITKYTKEEQQILLKGMQLLSSNKDR